MMVRNTITCAELLANSQNYCTNLLLMQTLSGTLRQNVLVCGDINEDSRVVWQVIYVTRLKGGTPKVCAVMLRI